MPVDYLEHYGVLGMKWGVRRYQNADGSLTNAGKVRYGSPYQAGHKPKTSTEKWKAKQLDQIDRLYNKSYKKLNKAYKEEPLDESIAKYKKELEANQAKDRAAIEKMTFMDVERARSDAKAQSKEKRKAVVKTAGNAAMWTAKMTLIGLRIGGTVALFNVLADAGNTAMDFLNSPEGQKIVQTGGDLLRDFGNGELNAISIAKRFILGKAPDSNLAKSLNQIDVESLMPGANYVPPDKVGEALSGVSEGLDKASKLKKKYMT